MKKNIIILFVLFAVTLQSQELNALVTINSQKIQSTNRQVFETLQNALTEFINQTEWTRKKVRLQERINCAFNIIINEQDGNRFSSSLQIQSTRPVFGSTYQTPLLNINDESFNFTYNEFDPLIFNPTRFDNNLIATIVFYVYVILGVDADTFALNGGNTFFKEAQTIALQAQQSGVSAWQNEIGANNRFALIDNFLSAKFAPIHTIYYNYHRKGLDTFSKNEQQAKQHIEDSILQLQKMFNITVGNFMIRTFLDAKSDEIVTVFSDGKATRNQGKMVTTLQKISPLNNNKWKKIH